jgi:hypothetical protein
MKTRHNISCKQSTGYQLKTKNRILAGKYYLLQPKFLWTWQLRTQMVQGLGKICQKPLVEKVAGFILRLFLSEIRSVEKRFSTALAESILVNLLKRTRIKFKYRY